MRKLSKDEIFQRLASSGRDDVKVVEKSITAWSKPAKFYDYVAGEYFWARPLSVCNYGAKHKSRKTEKLQLWAQKHGVKNTSQLSWVKEKKRQKSLQVYGTENVFQAEEIKSTIKQTYQKRYGVDYPQQSQTIRSKTYENNIEKYGVKVPTMDKKVIDKALKTRKEKHQNGEYESYYKRIEDTGEVLKVWFNKQPKPKPSYKNFVASFKGQPVYSSELRQRLNAYKDSKTQLEYFTENLISKRHYNKIPQAILPQKYRPDFKLNDTTYLNVDGLYWHSMKWKDDKWYHFNLRKCFEEHNLRIIQLRENEIRQNPQLCKSIIEEAVENKARVVNANTCTIQSVPHKEASKFLQQNSLQGSISSKHIGLYDNCNTLLMMLSFKQKNQVAKIERYCTRIGFKINKGFPFLLRHLESYSLIPEMLEIHCWINLRYDIGDFLCDNGFQKVKDVLGYQWTNCLNDVNSYKIENYAKIYDAGNRLFVKRDKGWQQR